MIRKATLLIGLTTSLSVFSQPDNRAPEGSGTAVVSGELSSFGNLQSATPTFVDAVGVRNTVQIRGGSDREEASIQIGFKKGTRDTYNFTFTTPIDKEKKEGSFATLDGLSNSIRLKASFNRAFPFSEKYRSDRDGLEAACVEAGKIFGWTKDETIDKFYNNAGCDELTDPASAGNESLYNEDNDKVSVTQTSIKENRKKLQEIRKKNIIAGIGYKDAAKTQGRRWLNMFKADATLGSEEFKYLQSDLVTEKEKDETEWSIELGWRWVNVVDRVAVGVNYRREHIYDANEKGTLCVDSAVPNVLSCKTSFIGGPVEKDKNLAVVNMDWLHQKWAMSSIVTYDFEEDEYGIEIPFYLIRNKDSAWNGGVSFGWESKERDITAQIFIGVPFEGLN